MDWLSTIVGSVVGTIVTLIGALFIPPIRRWWRYRNSTVKETLHRVVDRSYLRLDFPLLNQFQMLLRQHPGTIAVELEDRLLEGLHEVAVSARWARDVQHPWNTTD